MKYGSELDINPDGIINGSTSSDVTNTIVLVVKNRGKGQSFKTLCKRFEDDYEEMNFGLISVDDYVAFRVDKGTYRNLILESYDIYDNKYIQHFEVATGEDCNSISVHQPDLVERTTRARYQQ